MRIKTEKGNYEIDKSISLVVPSEEGEKYKQIFASSPSFETHIRQKLGKKITNEDIKAAVAAVGNVILELTQNCNLRCSYCIYGGEYKHFREHSAKTMTPEIAKKAIDFYYRLVLSPNQSSRIPGVQLSYYGGEPLMEFETLKESVDYASSHPDASRVKLGFNMATNGILLTPERVEYLVDSNFLISISLDGPESEHDRFRINQNKKGSFRKLMENVRFIKEKYPEYYDKRIKFTVTLHPFHDLKKIEAFFLDNDGLFNWDKLRINDIKGSSLGNSSVFEARKDFNRKKQEELEKNRWFYRKIYAEPIENAIGSGETHFLTSSASFTRNCFPGGSRLLVDPDGNLHICEKINRHFGIGSVDEGFDYDRIRMLYEKWREKIIELKCWKCECLYFCPFCFASTGIGSDIVLQKEKCLEQEKLLNKRIYYYLNILENDDEKTSNNHHLALPDFLDSL